MKKLFLVSAIGVALASTLSTDVNAAPISANVSSNITGVQLWVGQVDVMTREAPGYFNNFAFSGTAFDLDGDSYIDSADLNLDGTIGFTVNGLNARLEFGLTDGSYTPGAGITFSGGSIRVDVESTGGWMPYSWINAGNENLGFLANQPGHMAWDYPGQTTAGIVRDALPGLWNGVVGSPGFNRAAGSFSVLGQMVGFYFQGTIEAQYFTFAPDYGINVPNYLHFGAPEVPVPGAAWLFGTALLGLAGARRLRR